MAATSSGGRVKKRYDFARKEPFDSNLTKCIFCRKDIDLRVELFSATIEGHKEGEQYAGKGWACKVCADNIFKWVGKE